MNKPELIEKCTYSLGSLPLKTVEVAFDSILELMVTSLVNGERIEIRGFGSFSLKTMEPRTGRNPKSGALVNLGKTTKVHFKPGKELKERVNATME